MDKKHDINGTMALMMTNNVTSISGIIKIFLYLPITKTLIEYYT